MTMVPYFYRCYPTRIKDADSVKLYVDRGEDIYTDFEYRLKGVDAPETYRPKSDLERQYGQRATQWLIDQIAHIDDFGQLFVQTFNKKDSFGRTLGILWLDNPAWHGSRINLNDSMITEKIAWKWGEDKDLTQLKPLD